MIEHMTPSYRHVLLTVRKMRYGFQEVLCQSVDATLTHAGLPPMVRGSSRRCDKLSALKNKESIESHQDTLL